MPRLVIKRMCLTAVALATLAGCGNAAAGGEPEAGASATPTQATQDKKLQMESAKADCMKQKGFKYVAYVPPEKKKTATDLKRESGDYQEMRKHREKYGFEVFATLVYPGQVPGQENPPPDPNEKITAKLSTAQQQPYYKAQDQCFAEAAKKVLGKSVTSRRDYNSQFSKTKRAIVAREINNDPELVRLASAMADCLRGKGHPVGKTSPRELAISRADPFYKLMDKIGREQLNGKFTPGPDEVVTPELTPAEAKPYLQKEIKVALDDLECGKDFYAAYEPKDSAINNRLFAEFAM